MEPHERKPQSKLHEPSALLAAFIDGGRGDALFAALVQRPGPLVFHSACRRTGNLVMAEEITQNVLALLARKAVSLRTHPNLSAGIFRTTQLESAKAMRSEQATHIVTGKVVHLATELRKSTGG